jgi:hypothetical protein
MQDVLLEADSEAEACDTDGLRPIPETFERSSSWIDRCYAKPNNMPVNHNGSGFEYAPPRRLFQQL